jgi:glycosyltransferase involved in cell wall biosynthesis
MKYFKSLKVRATNSFDHYFAFVVKKDAKLYKIVIDFWDKNIVNEQAYNWCNIYAKINFNQSATEEKYLAKIIAIPPGFGIKIWNKKKTIYYAVSNLMKSLFIIPVSIRRFIGSYRITYNRPSIENYLEIKQQNQNQYIFFISSLWTHKNCIETTNKLRYEFMKKAKLRERKGEKFEGGFYAAIDNPEYAKYKEFIFTNRYSTIEYINKTKKSYCVFNAPAVHNCHGWKLGEFLAMGKAIISTPLFNDLQPVLLHGENIHFVKNEQDIENAISLICDDVSYRKKLENGAREYFEKYASPVAVINTIIKNVAKSQ